MDRLNNFKKAMYSELYSFSKLKGLLWIVISGYAFVVYILFTAQTVTNQYLVGLYYSKQVALTFILLLGYIYIAFGVKIISDDFEQGILQAKVAVNGRFNVIISKGITLLIANFILLCIPFIIALIYDYTSDFSINFPQLFSVFFIAYLCTYVWSIIAMATTYICKSGLISSSILGCVFYLEPYCTRYFSNNSSIWLIRWNEKSIFHIFFSENSGAIALVQKSYNNSIFALVLLTIISAVVLFVFSFKLAREDVL